MNAVVDEKESGSEDEWEMDQKFRDDLIKRLTQLDGKVDTANGSINSLSQQVNGRFKRLEDTTFGNEEKKMIGLTEKVRGLSWKSAVVISAIVFTATQVGNLVFSRVAAAIVGKANKMEARIK